MADSFLHLPVEDRRDALGVAADRSGRPAHLLEKDVWVVWALATLYGSALGEHLVFKGGTSLSKAYQVIRRFSEDVDLTYDIRAIAPDLAGGDGEALPKNRSEEKRWSSEVRKRLPEWVEGSVQPIIVAALAAEGLTAAIRVEGEKLFIDYEATTAGSIRRTINGRARELARRRLRRGRPNRGRGLSHGSSSRHARRANLLGEGDCDPCLLPAGAAARGSLCSSLA
jgi:hypothetical protein